MTYLKVAAGVVNQTPMSWESNAAHIIAAIEAAQQQQVAVLCLPELCITGYGCEDYFFSQDLSERAFEKLLHIATFTADIAVAIGLPMRVNHRLYNAVAFVANKRILGFYLKQNLPNDGIHYESRWFKAWPAGVVGAIEWEGVSYPVGDLLFDLGGVRVGFEICEDAWVADRPGKRHYQRGVDLILNPSASHFALGKFITRERLVVESSRAFGCGYIYTNLLGNEAGRAIYDGDALIAQQGKLLVTSHRFSYEDAFIVSATLDLSKIRLHQQQQQLGQQPHDNKWLSTAGSFRLQEASTPLPQQAELEAFEKGGFVKEEEFARAVSLGLFDYLRKSRSRGFTISLSGGADSAACTALCGLMIRLAEESIGLDAFKQKLSYIPEIQEVVTPKEITRLLVHTIYQATENSSNETRHAARSLAESIGAVFYEININTLVQTYTRLIEEQIQRSLNWEQDDLALQNIQARVRAPGVWLLTNLSNHLLLATSNRSEVAVGYATMDGDTAGSISPIAGIDKHWLRHWLRWLEQTGCEVLGQHIRIEGLAAVNALSPTAELRPKEASQTDEADLMPYEVLNELEAMAIRDKKTPTESFRGVLGLFQGRYEEGALRTWTERFYRLWSRNQWKRERYAPSFHLDDRSLDPRTWCRFPILSGGFAQELQELKTFDVHQPVKGHKRIGFK